MSNHRYDTLTSYEDEYMQYILFHQTRDHAYDHHTPTPLEKEPNKVDHPIKPLKKKRVPRSHPISFTEYMNLFFVSYFIKVS